MLFMACGQSCESLLLNATLAVPMVCIIATSRYGGSSCYLWIVKQIRGSASEKMEATAWPAICRRHLVRATLLACICHACLDVRFRHGPFRIGPLHAPLLMVQTTAVVTSQLNCSTASEDNVAKALKAAASSALLLAVPTLTPVFFHHLLHHLGPAPCHIALPLLEGEISSFFGKMSCGVMITSSRVMVASAEA